MYVMRGPQSEALIRQLRAEGYKRARITQLDSSERLRATDSRRLSQGVDRLREARAQARKRSRAVPAH
jgi:hypothetical protein